MKKFIAPNLNQKFDQKRSPGSVAGVPAGGIVIVADIVKVAKRTGGSIVLVKMEVGHLEENQQLNLNLNPGKGSYNVQ